MYWFATNAHWTAILITLLPLQAELIGGAEFKGTTLGQILMIGALASMIVAPLFGAWSDRVRTRWGQRKPFVVASTIGNVLGLRALAYIPSSPAALVPYILAYIWIELFKERENAGILLSGIVDQGIKMPRFFASRSIALINLDLTRRP